MTTVNTTTNNEGQYEVTLSVGNVVAISEADVVAIQTAFEATHNRPSTLPLSELLAMIATNSEEEMTLEDWVEAMWEAEPTSADDTADLEAEKEQIKRADKERSVIGALVVRPEDTKGKSKSVAIVDQEATRIGSILSGNQDLVDDIKNLIAVTDARKRLPVAIAWHIGQILDKEIIQGLPIPGSTRKSLDEMGLKNHKPDLGKVGEPSFYAQLALSFPDYVSIIKTIGYIDAAKDVDNADTKPFRAMSTSERATEKTMWVGRRSTFVGSIKNGIKLLWKFYSVEDKLTNLKAEFRTEKHDGRLQIMRKTALIKVVDVVKHEAKYFTMGSFNAVDIDRVSETEDHFANFEAARESGAGKTPEANIVINTPVHFENAMASLAAHADDDAFSASLYLEAMKADNGDFRLSLFESAKIINQLCASPQVKALYKQDVDAIAKSEAKQAAELSKRAKAA
jgi:hypothetical protein